MTPPKDFYSSNQSPALYESVNVTGKIHISAFRILFLLKLMSQLEQVYVTDINNHLLSHPLIGRTFVSETLQKHLYTIQLTGWKINRFYKDAQWFIQVVTNPLKFNFTTQDYQMLVKLIYLVRSRPIFGEFQKLIQLLTTMSSQDEVEKLTNPSLLSLDNRQHRYSLDLIEKIKAFEGILVDNQVVEIHYASDTGDKNVFHVEPLQLVFANNKVFLLVINTETNKKSRFDVERIVQYRQLPSRSRSRTILTSVHFKLSGRLAKSYRKYPNEQVHDKGDHLLVTHTTDDIESLFLRLLKYGSSCEVLSPKWVRDAMLNMIHQRIAILDTDVELSVVDYVAKREQQSIKPN